MDFDFLLNDEDNILDVLIEDDFPRVGSCADYDEADELIRDIPSAKLPDKKVKTNQEKVSCTNIEVPVLQVQHVPPTSAEAIMMNACATLRATGMRFINDVGTAHLTLEEFREAFYGSGEGTGSDPGDDDDAEDDDEESFEGKGNSKNKKRKRTSKRPNNPDADLIVSATEETMRLLGADSNSRDGKSQRRRIRNRMSAQLHRERKSMYIDALEAFVRIKDKRISQLEADARKLVADNDRFRVIGHAGSSTTNTYSATTTSASSGSTTAESDSESISSSSCPASPFVAERETNFAMVRPANTGTGINGGTGVRNTGVTRHLMPLLSVIFMIACCFRSDSGMLGSPVSFEVSQSSVAMPLGTPTTGRRLMNLVTTEENPGVQQALLELPSPLNNAVAHREDFLNDQWSGSPRARAAENRAGRTDRRPSNVDNSMALWKYTRDDMLTTLYPPLADRVVKSVTQKERRNLRSRESSITNPTHLKSSAWEASSFNALTTISGSHPGAVNAPLQSQSHIMMLSGKALLDPSMTLKGSTSTAHLHSHVPGSLPTIGAPIDAASSSAESNTLVMLLPTSSIRWGKSWADSSAGTTAALLQGLRLANSEDGAADEYDHADVDGMYVEIVCSISRAQLIKNVTMAM